MFELFLLFLLALFEDDEQEQEDPWPEAVDWPNDEEDYRED